jgi:glycine/D-amino acid oxidase-like deaminating enzyme
LALQSSIAWPRRAAPHAFGSPPAFALQRAGASPPAEEYFVPLGIAHHRVSAAVWARWFPMLPLAGRYDVFHVADGTIDLRLLGHALTREARRAGAELAREGVAALDVLGDRVHALLLRSGEAVTIGPGDVVVLACGANIPPLLAGAFVPGPCYGVPTNAPRGGVRACVSRSTRGARTIA